MSIFKRTTDQPEQIEPLVLPPPEPQQLEQDIKAVLEFAPPAHREPPTMPLPDYVQHDPEASDTGKAAAQSVIAEYERTAQQVEAMGAELVEVAKRGAQIIAEMEQCIAYIRDTAQSYREHGKRVFEEMERKSVLTSNVRRLCEDMRTQLGEKP